jgi:hypothetical protein
LQINVHHIDPRIIIATRIAKTSNEDRNIKDPVISTCAEKAESRER